MINYNLNIFNNILHQVQIQNSVDYLKQFMHQRVRKLFFAFEVDELKQIFQNFYELINLLIIKDPTQPLLLIQMQFRKPLLLLLHFLKMSRTKENQYQNQLSMLFKFTIVIPQCIRQGDPFQFQL
ncbi:unnamed protein product [Paramecium sonneborni]|uniref:Uncharacterized protein n=1 Tax=Paramecium sonneborni TaxID=65129 RepID=A0A8S1KGU3_9CILI|nr:unnamed protein product [Paramecium sonneborni]